MKHILLSASCLLAAMAASVSGAKTADIVIDASHGRIPVSPGIFGKNNNFSDDPAKPLSEAQWQFLRDAGVRLFRECGGNNSTKYNWKLKLSSHPDWYNNVYPHDWDFVAQSAQKNLPGTSVMFGFQLIGKAAGTDKHNFDAGAFNNHQWSPAVNSNWAGGGGPGKPDGNPNLYLVDWPPEIMTGILDHWFGPKGLGLDSEMFTYWNMDNEPEIWSGTHDDIMKGGIPVEDFISRYLAVARLARKKFPGIKLAGPVTCNEWQWFNWNNDRIKTPEGEMVWIEYFIKRIGEEQKKSGIRLLDVLDLHWYPGEKKPEEIVQLHRVWFDTNYEYPGANGLKRLGPSGWNEEQKKEYIFTRCRRWLDQYLGPDHGVTLGVSETGIEGNNPNITALWYASTLGVFADEGVELFTPWSWKIGMWEVLHLFSQYSRPVRVSTTSALEPMVSAYASVSEDDKSATVFLVNRDPAKTRKVSVKISHLAVRNGRYKILILSDLPTHETFKSRTENALRKSSVKVKKGAFTIQLPSTSVVAVVME